MPCPSAADQIRFLQQIQQLFDEGSFVATYKYALLLALADLSVEIGDDSGDALDVPLTAIAEKFIQYYWPQARPYPDTTPASVLYQNTGRQAAIVNYIADAQTVRGHSLAKLRNDQRNWKSLVGKVTRVVENMPLWRLQVVGAEPQCFLYLHTLREGCITFLPGVAYNLRALHPMITHMVQGAWAANVRRIAKNQCVLGQRADLSEFLFGSERNDLSTYRGVLLDTSGSTCFYCEKSIQSTPAVDHFIAWARYPVDLGHNFVLAHTACNTKKSDYLPSLDHLDHWLERNRQFDDNLVTQFDERRLTHDLATSTQVAEWAYGQTASRDGQLWVHGNEFQKIDADWWTRFRDSS
jgi:5-methylcytosine-specific restriction endonuclease McrA